MRPVKTIFRLSGHLVGLLLLVCASGAFPVTSLAQSSSFPISKRAEKTAASTGVAFSVSVDTGNASADTLAGLEAASKLLSGRVESLEKPSDLINLAKAEYRRMLSALYGRGLFGATVSIRLNGHEAADFPFEAALAAPIGVDITVTTGPQFSYGSVRIAPAPEGLVPHAAVAAGMPADTAGIKAAVAEILLGWRSRGHPLARIAANTIIADHTRHVLDVDIRIDPGPQARFGQAEIVGADGVDPAFAAYVADLTLDELFTPEALARARDRLLRLGTFRSVAIEEGGRLTAEGRLPVRFLVTESPRRKLSASLALSTGDGASAAGSWTHRNLFGHAERLHLYAAIEGVGARSNLSKLDFSLGAEFRKPGVLAPEIDFIAALRIDRTVVGSVDTANASLEAGLRRTRSTATESLLAFVSSSRTIDTSSTRFFRPFGLKYNQTWDNRNSALDATSGRYVSLDLMPYAETTFSEAGLRLALEGRAYRAIGNSDRVVFAVRGYAGSLIGTPLASSPGDFLFFSGGGGSVRGYAYNSRGVTTAGVFSGGLSVVNANAEIRAAVSEKLGLVGFVDAGVVGRGVVPDFGSNLFVGIGFGLRYHTSFGPVRFDIARGVNRVPGDPAFAIYLGLGQAF